MRLEEMAEKIIPISEFPQDDRIWRVEYKRAIEQNSLVPSEPTIEIVIARFKPEVEKEYKKKPNSQKFNSILNVDKTQTIRIGIGQFPLIVIGSLWTNGYLIRENVGVIKTLKLDITDKTTQYVKGFHKDILEDENGIHEEQILSTYQHNISPRGVYSECVGIEYEGDPFGVIVPITTLIKFYYCTSTAMSSAIFNGDFQHNIDRIINPEFTYTDEKLSLSSLKLRIDVPDNDAWIISRILYTDEGKRGATLVHDSLMAQRADMNYKWMYPKSKFPFTGKTTLKVIGKPIKCKARNKWRFLVFDIVSCSAPFPYNRQEVFRDNCGITSDPETDFPDVEKKDAFPNKKQKPEIENPPLSSNEEPVNSINPEHIIQQSNKFLFLTRKTIEKPPKESCEYKSPDAKSYEDTMIDKLGTGEGTFGESKTGKARVISREKALEATFDNFVSAIDTLDLTDEYSARILPALPNITSIPLTRSAKLHQWSYLNSKAKIRRDVIIAEVTKGDRYYYLIEFALRTKEKCQIGIINHKTFCNLSHATLHKILIQLAQAKGRWGNLKSPPQDLKVNCMKHSWTSETAFCKTFISKIT